MAMMATVVQLLNNPCMLQNFIECYNSMHLMAQVRHALYYKTFVATSEEQQTNLWHLRQWCDRGALYD